MRQIARFSAIGCFGFCVDAGTLSLLVNVFGLGLYASRLLSFSAAVTCTWYANRRSVFMSVQPAPAEYSRYLAIQTIGAGINFCAYVALIERFPAFEKMPIVPLAIGAAAALIFNYIASVRYVFASANASR